MKLVVALLTGDLVIRRGLHIPKRWAISQPVYDKNGTKGWNLVYTFSFKTLGSLRELVVPQIKRPMMILVEPQILKPTFPKFPHYQTPSMGVDPETPF